MGRRSVPYLNLARHMVLSDRPNGAHIQWLSNLLGQDFVDFGFGSDKKISFVLESRGNLNVNIESDRIQKVATALGRKARTHTFRPKSTYSCPACHKNTTTSMNLARHMIAVADPAHIQWIESHGISFLGTLGLRAGTLGKGSYRELAQVLERLKSSSDSR